MQLALDLSSQAVANLAGLLLDFKESEEHFNADGRLHR
jgi:hypothetical protein